MNQIMFKYIIHKVILSFFNALNNILFIPFKKSIDYKTSLTGQSDYVYLSTISTIPGTVTSKK